MEELDLFLVYDAIVWQYHYSNICVYFDNHARYETKQLQIPRKNEWDNQRSFQKGAAEYFGLWNRISAALFIPICRNVTVAVEKI